MRNPWLTTLPNIKLRLRRKSGTLHKYLKEDHHFHFAIGNFYRVTVRNLKHQGSICEGYGPECTVQSTICRSQEDRNVVPLYERRGSRPVRRSARRRFERSTPPFLPSFVSKHAAHDNYLSDIIIHYIFRVNGFLTVTGSLNVDFNSSSPSFYRSVWPLTDPQKVGDKKAQDEPLHRFDRDAYKKVKWQSHLLYDVSDTISKHGGVTEPSTHKIMTHRFQESSLRQRQRPDAAIKGRVIAQVDGLSLVSLTPKSIEEAIYRVSSPYGFSINNYRTVEEAIYQVSSLKGFSINIIAQVDGLSLVSLTPKSIEEAIYRVSSPYGFSIKTGRTTTRFKNALAV
ncbi:hypothetical protein J6590_082107 [Homalodisca vitripennis]|nr:hypothetical protein J6590_082107 [Homalodisca vitripennis]